jgi:hypothetical protein
MDRATYYYYVGMFNSGLNGGRRVSLARYSTLSSLSRLCSSVYCVELLDSLHLAYSTSSTSTGAKIDIDIDFPGEGHAKPEYPYNP